MPIAKELRHQLVEVFRIAEKSVQTSVVVRAGDLHRVVGEYPDRKTHRMPVCSIVMRSAMRTGDVVVGEPRKGQGATPTIRYSLSCPGLGEAA